MEKAKNCEDDQLRPPVGHLQVQLGRDGLDSWPPHMSHCSQCHAKGLLPLQHQSPNILEA